MFGLSELTAAQLSQAAYPDTPTPPVGWLALSSYSGVSSDGKNSFTTFANDLTGQVVIAFKGSNNASNLYSDLINDGGSAWESVASQFATALKGIQSDPRMAGYTIMTTGHSLGGGMAQTAALEYGLSGYGQNALPISEEAIANDTKIKDAGGIAIAHGIWLAEGNTFIEVNAEGEPATAHYLGKYYLSTTIITLKSPWAALETTAAEDNNAQLLALAAYDNHRILNIIQLETIGGLTDNTPKIDLFLKDNSSEIDSGISDFAPIETSTGFVSAPTSDGIQYSALLVSDTDSTENYAVTANGRPNQSDIVTTNGNTVTITTDIDPGAKVEIFSDQFALADLTAVSQILQFAGATGTLLLDQPDNFTGTILNSKSGDTIDLSDASVSAGVLGATNILTLQSSSGTIELKFDPSQSFAGDSFLITPDGTGGSDLTVVDDSAQIAFTGPGEMLLVTDPTSNLNVYGFVPGTPATFANAYVSVPGDTIDLAGVSASSATFSADNVLTLKGSSGAITLYLDPSESFTDDSFLIGPDGNGGTEIAVEDDGQAIAFTKPGQVLLVNGPAMLNDLSYPNGGVYGFLPGDTVDISGVLDRYISVSAGEFEVNGSQFIELGDYGIEPPESSEDNYLLSNYLVSPDGAGGATILALSNTSDVALTGNQALYLERADTYTGSISNFDSSDSLVAITNGAFDNATIGPDNSLVLKQNGTDIAQINVAFAYTNPAVFVSELGITTSQSLNYTQLTYGIGTNASGYLSNGYNIPEAINNDGEVIGLAATGGDSPSYIYQDGSYTIFLEPITPGSIGTYNGEATLYGLNDQGAVVGIGQPFRSGATGFLYSNGELTEIDGPSGHGIPKAITDDGTIYGDIDSTATDGGFILRDGVYTDFVYTSASGVVQAAEFISASEHDTYVLGLIAATAHTSPQYFLQEDGKDVLLPQTLGQTALGIETPELFTSYTAVNDLGDLGGNFDESFAPATSLFVEKANGELVTVDLPFSNVQSLSNLPGSTYGVSLNGLNDSDQVVGFYQGNDSVDTGFLDTPIAETATPATAPNPPLTLPATLTVSEGLLAAIANVSLGGSGSTAGESFTVTLTDTTGLLAAAGSGVTGSGTTSLTITGSLAQVETDLAALTDTENSTAADNITVDATDSVGTSSTATIAVTVAPSTGIPIGIDSVTVATPLILDPDTGIASAYSATIHVAQSIAVEARRVTQGGAAVSPPPIPVTINLTSGEYIPADLANAVTGGIDNNVEINTNNSGVATVSLNPGSPSATLELPYADAGTTVPIEVEYGGGSQSASLFVSQGDVYSPAVPEVSTAQGSLTPDQNTFTANLGIVHVGDTSSLNVSLTNGAAGTLTDTLVATAQSSGIFSASVPSDGLAAGDSETLQINVVAQNAGFFSATVASFASHDADLSDLAVGGITANVQVDNFAAPIFVEEDPPPNSGTLTQVGNNWTLDLGTVDPDNPAGSDSTFIELENAATGYSDSLSGTVSISGDTLLGQQTGEANETISGGQSNAFGFFDGGYDANPGVHTEALVFHPTDSNASGYSESLPDVTLTVTSEVACFLAGSRIAVVRGDIAVEVLAIGDAVLRADGTSHPITWLGHRHIDCSRHPYPRDIWPVRIAPGAFGPAQPSRDLFLSPDHAVYVEGVLIPIKYLINGTTIVQEPRDQVTYWHVELEQHGVILAEGLACESYLDTNSRGAFSNGGAVVEMHPSFGPGDGSAAMWEAAGYAPLRIEGDAVDRASAHLDRRAAERGHVRNPRHSSSPATPNTADLADLLQPAWYLNTNPDVAAAGVDAATHYVQWAGRWEGRRPCPDVDLVRGLGLVDPGTLAIIMPDVIAAGVDPVEHFCAVGWTERRPPNPYFDTGWYLDTHDVPAGMNPLLHYVLLGESHGLLPSRHFDPAWYRARYAIGHTVSPLAHYLMHRRTQCFSPLPAFDVSAYCQMHAATLLSARDPYAHFLAIRRFDPARLVCAAEAA